MCNRYRFTDKIDALTRVFVELSLLKVRLTPRFNVAPTQQAPVLASGPDGQADLRMLRWGLVPSWSRDSKSSLLNARSETAAEKPSFRDAFRHRRCLVIAHGFYEWQTTPHGKQPWHFHLKGDDLMALAGLWEPTVAPPAAPAGSGAEESAPGTFAILTTAANSLVGRLHDRMPVILPEEAWRAWIAPGTPREQLDPWLHPFDPAAMESWPVTRRMSNARYESPDCARPIVPDDLELKLE